MRRDLIALGEDSKVWIYQSTRLIEDSPSMKIKEELYNFTMNWQSHGHQVESYANLFHNRFVVVVASDRGLPSGCSIDSSVHFVKDLGRSHQLDFFNRMYFSYLESDKVKCLDAQNFKLAYKDGLIDNRTLVFDNLVKTKADFLDHWIVPLEESWLLKFVR